MLLWLSTSLSEYPETLSLKMWAHTQEPGKCRNFDLARSDHLLSQEYHHGVSPQRVKEIMLARLRESA